MLERPQDPLPCESTWRNKLFLSVWCGRPSFHAHYTQIYMEIYIFLYVSKLFSNWNKLWGCGWHEVLKLQHERWCFCLRSLLHNELKVQCQRNITLKQKLHNVLHWQGKMNNSKLFFDQCPSPLLNPPDQNIPPFTECCISTFMSKFIRGEITQS